MATIRLVPSTYYLSNSSYLSVSNASNMYNNTDNTTYATVTNSQNGTSSYYIYLRGFSFSDVPSNAVVSSITIKVKGYESGLSTSTSYAPRLYNGTSTISTATTATQTFSTSTRTITVPYTGDWETLKTYGSNLGIRCTVRRASRNTTGYLYLQGAEIEVEYTVPVSATVTTTLSGNGTISPSGASSVYEDDEFTLTITPANTADTVTVTNNGTDVTSQLVGHGAGDTVSATPESVTTSGVQSGAQYMEYAVGHSAENPYSSTNNAYASNNSTGYAEYSFDFSDIPAGATIEDVSVSVAGHRENATIDSTHVSQVQLYSGSTAKGDAEDFTSTSAQTITISDPGTWTQTELQSAKLRHTVGYYGGLVTGVTWSVTYSTGGGITHYTYTYTVTGDATIAVTIGSSASDVAYIKVNGAWVAASKVYKKVSGIWVEQTDLANIFESGVNYKCSVET